jgi:hypothetical protein
MYSILLCAEFFNQPLKRHLSSLEVPEQKTESSLGEIEGIRTGEENEGGRTELIDEKNWWRCRDLNPGHCGYEPHALTD